MTKKIIEVLVGTPTLATYSNLGEKYAKIEGQISVRVGTSIKELMKELQYLQNEYGKDYTDLELREMHNCGCWGSCDCSPSLMLQGKRLETDLEYNLRLEHESKRKAEQDARDRADFERLQRKFKEA